MERPASPQSANGAASAAPSGGVWTFQGDNGEGLGVPPSTVPTTLSNLVQSSVPLAPTGGTSPSGATTTHDPAAQGSGGGLGERNNAVIIAGAVVGSLAGFGLIVGALFIAFRMGKRSQCRQSSETSSRGFGGKLRSIPRPTITWTKPDPQRQHDGYEQQPIAAPKIVPPIHETKTNTSTNEQPISLVHQEQAQNATQNPAVELSVDIPVIELATEKSRA